MLPSRCITSSAGVEFALVEQQPFVLDAGIGHHADTALRMA